MFLHIKGYTYKGMTFEPYAINPLHISEFQHKKTSNFTYYWVTDYFTVKMNDGTEHKILYADNKKVYEWLLEQDLTADKE